LLIKKAESWGVFGSSAFEIKLLLEIMANIRPYENGRCVLMGKRNGKT
jgi:ABC-2 type transport system ATP-binding protein